MSAKTEKYKERTTFTATHEIKQKNHNVMSSFAHSHLLATLRTLQERGSIDPTKKDEILEKDVSTLKFYSTQVQFYYENQATPYAQYLMPPSSEVLIGPAYFNILRNFKINMSEEQHEFFVASKLYATTPGSPTHKQLQCPVSLMDYFNPIEGITPDLQSMELIPQFLLAEKVNLESFMGEFDYSRSYFLPIDYRRADGRLETIEYFYFDNSTMGLI